MKSNNQGGVMSQPNVIGATGESQTRVFARISCKGGMFIRTELNKSEDLLPFAHHADSWINTYRHYTEKSLPIKIRQEMHQSLRTCIKQHLLAIDLVKSSQFLGGEEPRSIFLMPFLHQYFPRMKLLYVLRDGRDIAYSQNQLVKHGVMFLAPTEQEEWSQPVQFIALWSRLHLETAEYGEKEISGQYVTIQE